mmetsp:Transcript_77455/g.166019  ORF Transcript_77455/g.166019 Transcript_77455/m.166019 type:complete len:195 (+) Transcript_77455:134-718(+)
MGRRRSPSESESSRSESHHRRRRHGHRHRRHKSDRDESRSRDRGRRRGGGRSQLDKFIEENELNDSAISRLRGASKEVQDQVMEQGWNVIDNARNASAVVISRLRKIEDGGPDKGGPDKGRSRDRGRSRSPARNGDGGGASGAPVEYRAGDWYCDACGAMNFSRRDECFKCNAPRPGPGGRGGKSRSRSRSRRR